MNKTTWTGYILHADEGKYLYRTAESRGVASIACSANEMETLSNSVIEVTKEEGEALRTQNQA